MFKRLAKWHHDWEIEGLRVLENPEVAQTLAPGFRRYLALKLASLSPFERQQMHEFSLRYMGWRAYAAMGKVILVCMLGAFLLHLAVPRLPLGKLMIGGVIASICFTSMYISAWYNFRTMNEHKTRLILFIGMAVLGNLTGASIAGIEKGRSMMMVLERLPPVIMMTVGGVALVMVPFALVAFIRNNHYQLWTAKLEHEAEREKSARALSEAQLRMLRAQIEPHFLFNTLGAVQQLAEQGAPRAAALTAHLIDFLRASLAGMRSDNNSLRDEVALVASYLEVMHTRMGERLRFQLDLPEELAETRVPGMMLLTLVENAIKHGIEPSLGGGHITLTASQHGATVRIEVADSGVGMSAVPGKGEGLENIRSRLRLAYGEAGALRLQERPDGGVIASIELPLETMKVAS